MSNEAFDCGHARHGAPVRPWPDFCPRCSAEDYDLHSKMWATVRTLAVLLVMLFLVAAACGGGAP